MGVFAGVNSWWMSTTDAGKNHAATRAVVQDSLLLNLDSTASGSYSGSGNTWTDLSGQGNHGTINGATYTSAEDAFYFDGYNDRVGCGDITGFNTNKLTLEAWVNVNSFTGNDGDTTGFIIQGGGTSLDFDLQTIKSGSTNKFNFRIGSSTNISSGSVSTDTWYHLLATYDGSSMEFYLNNSSVGTNSSTETFQNTRNVELGRYPVASENAFQLDGYLSVVRIYNDVLTSDEREKNFNAYRERFGV